VLGNVTFLERPFRPSTLGSVVRTALRGRRRQYEAKRAEEELHGLNENLESQVAERTRERDRTWALSQDLLAVAKSSGEIVGANPAWAAVLGRSAEDVRKLGFFELVHPRDDRGQAVQAVEALRGSRRRSSASRSGSGTSTRAIAGFPGRPCPKKTSSMPPAAT
jgi:PAS domain-containing protein